jgi:hypothetical protein
VRVAAVILGLVLFGGLVVLAVAGVSAATAVLVTGAAVVAMIGLGNAVGGRQTPNRAPYAPPSGDTAAAGSLRTTDGIAVPGATREAEATEAGAAADAGAAEETVVGDKAEDAER